MFVMHCVVDSKMSILNLSVGEEGLMALAILLASLFMPGGRMLVIKASFILF